MKQARAATLAALVLVTGALVAAPPAWAQGRGRGVPPPPEIGPDIGRGLRSIPRDFDFDAYLPQWMLRAPLGLTLAPLTDQLASFFGVKEGVLVSAVEAGSPAARAEIRAGDVLTAVNGRTLARPADVAASLRGATPGSTIEIRLVRNKQERAVKTMVPERQPLARERTLPI